MSKRPGPKGSSTTLVAWRIPNAILERVDATVSQGLYRNRGEVLLDALRRFFGPRE